MSLAHRAIISGLLFASTAHADPAAEDPARFNDPEEWDVTISFSCKGQKAGPVGAMSVTDTEATSASGTAHVTTSVGLGRARRLDGAFKGSYEVGSKSVAVLQNFEQTINTTASGASPGPKAHVRFEIHGTDNYFLVGIQDTEIKTSTVIALPGHTQTDAGTYNGDFVSEQLPLPAHGDTITWNKEIKADPCWGAMPLHEKFPRTLNVTAKPRKKLEAKPKLVAAFHRGEQAQLDGSDSTGHPTKFKWTVKPKQCPKVRTSMCNDSPDTAPSSPKPHEDKTWNVTLLCDADVTLEVSDDQGNSDSKTIPVTVTPRPWHIAFESTNDVSQAHTLALTGEKFFGANECDGAGEAGSHWIHAKVSSEAGGNDWRPFIKATTVHEADSPFDNFSYISDASALQVKRIERVNAEFYPGSGGGQCTGKTLYDYNAGVHNTQAIADLGGSVADHEHWHSQLVQQALAGGADPLIDLERAVGKGGEPALLDRAQQSMVYADNSLYGAAGEQRVHDKLKAKWNKTVKIYLCSKASPMPIQLANNGDDAIEGGGGTPAQCSGD